MIKRFKITRYRLLNESVFVVKSEKIIVIFAALSGAPGERVHGKVFYFRCTRLIHLVRIKHTSDN